MCEISQRQISITEREMAVYYATLYYTLVIGYPAWFAFEIAKQIWFG